MFYDDENKVLFSGRLAENTVGTRLASGTDKLTFKLISNKSVKQADDSFKDETTSMYVSYFGKMAEPLSKLIAKGDKVHVEGSLNVYKGENGYGTNITASKVTIIAQTDQNKAMRAANKAQCS